MQLATTSDFRASSTRSGSPLVEALAACRRHFYAAGIFSALLNLLFIVPMLYMIQVYDRVVPTQSEMTLLFLTLVLVAGLATLAFLDYVRGRLLIRASVRLDRQLAGAILHATLVNPGQAAHKVTRQTMREFDTLRQTIAGSGILALFDAPWTPIYILICFLIHPWVGILALVGAATLFFITWRNEKATREPLQWATEAAGVAYASQDQTAAAADTVRALGMRQSLIERHLHERHTMMALQTYASFQSGRFVAAAKFFRLLLQSLALGLGAFLAINQQITPGAIFASMFLVGRALAPIDQLLGAWKSIVQARGAYQTLWSLFASSPLDVAATQLPEPVGALDVESVVLASPEGDREILRNVSFQTLRGEAIGIVGPSGAGKSTLARVIAGATRPDSGCVRFDGAEQRDWDPERLADHIGYMPQEATLFAGTIKENIARFRIAAEGSADEIDVMAVHAAKMAGAHEMILRLPYGYDHQLGLGGRGLSMGQAQRIALARALFGSPKYLILDEPNAHLDADGDLQLITSLAEAKAQGTTIIIIAHKLSILPILDKVLVMKDGRIEMFGARDEVMRRIAPVRSPRGVPRPANREATG